jgi:phosphate-selective porin OprO/OprP
MASVFAMITLCPCAYAQEIPSQEPLGGTPIRRAAPAARSPSVPVETVPVSREAQLEARVRQLEAMVNQLSAQMQQLGAATATTATGPAPAPGTAAGTGTPAGADTPGPRGLLPSRSGGFGAPGQSLPPNPSPSERFRIPATLEDRKGNVRFGPGFEIRTDDDEFIFQFHNLTQFDYRGYQQYGQGAVKDSFLIPRQWFMFSGRITKPVGYFVSLAQAFDATNILDVFVDLTYDARLTIRAGRYKTPFTYEFFVEPPQGMLLPEQSIFFNNFGENRDLGVMAYGRLLNNKLDYATGIFNGARNGFVAPSDSKFISSFINYKPMGNSEGSLCENFNIGGSVFGGNEGQVPIPQTLRTIVPTAGNSVAGVPFLAFNNNVRQGGMLTLWDLHAAWFYQQWALIAEWASGFQDYALTSNMSARTHLPIESYYITLSYMLTGENRSATGIVKPYSPFSLRPGQFGTGAWELVGRYQFLDIGSQVFKSGLSDPNLWANRVYTTDLCVNWHINQYLKFTFDWEHAEFNQPVIYSPGKRQLTSDLFLARIQLYF